jgi:hypothetical protein
LGLKLRDNLLLYMRHMILEFQPRASLGAKADFGSPASQF